MRWAAPCALRRWRWPPRKPHLGGLIILASQNLPVQFHFHPELRKTSRAMATEVELRFVHVDIPALEQRLGDLGATFLSSGPLREVRFAGLSGSRGEYVRARDDSRTIRLQHKAHDPEGHSATERELPLDPGTTFEAAVEFLAGLGLKRILRVERHRTQWQLGPAIVTIDQLPRIPPHVEVEAERLDDVHTACAQLGLDPADHAGNGFVRIYRHYGVTLEPDDIVFTPQEMAAFPAPRFG